MQMAKRIKVLEKDCHEWRVKYEKCNRALLDMATDKQAQDQYVGKASRQLSQLQKLCRTLQVCSLTNFQIKETPTLFPLHPIILLKRKYYNFSQAERAVLLDLLKTHNIERPEMPELPPEPKDIEPAPKPADKLDVMTRDCNDLKRTLAQLKSQMQTQMNTLSAEKQKPEPVAAPSNKKNKNKKNKSKAEAKANATAAKAAAVNGESSQSNAAVEPEAATVPKVNPEVKDDKPLSELLSKVLAENPPIADEDIGPIADDLEEILNETQDELVQILDAAQKDDGSSAETPAPEAGISVPVEASSS